MPAIRANVLASYSLLCLGLSLSTFWVAPVTDSTVISRMFDCQIQPWRCLCRGSTQITLTLPLRRMILQFRQIFFTDARTFTLLLLLVSPIGLPGHSHAAANQRRLFHKAFILS